MNPSYAARGCTTYRSLITESCEKQTEKSSGCRTLSPIRCNFSKTEALEHHFSHKPTKSRSSLFLVNHKSEASYRTLTGQLPIVPPFCTTLKSIEYKNPKPSVSSKYPVIETSMTLSPQATSGRFTPPANLTRPAANLFAETLQPGSPERSPCHLFPITRVTPFCFLYSIMPGISFGSWAPSASSVMTDRYPFWRATRNPSCNA